MLTAWAKKVMAVQRASGVVPHVSTNSTSVAYIEAVSMAGNSKYIPPMPYENATYPLISDALVESGAYSSVGVAFGADGTAATENDYTLGGHITGLRAVTPSIQTIYDGDNNRYVARLDFSVSNDTGAAVTIREVGLFVRFNTAASRGGTASSSSNSRFSFMMDRTVLSSPVTIPDGEAATVRYEFAYQG
jgi:hypothetical protein